VSSSHTKEKHRATQVSSASSTNVLVKLNSFRKTNIFYLHNIFILLSLKIIKNMYFVSNIKIIKTLKLKLIKTLNIRVYIFIIYFKHIIHNLAYNIRTKNPRKKFSLISLIFNKIC